MGRSGTQGFEFKFGKNWNFNLSNFCIVITRPRRFKKGGKVKNLYTYPGIEFIIVCVRYPYNIGKGHKKKIKRNAHIHFIK